MNRSAARAAIVTLAFVAIPLVYNACGAVGKSASYGGAGSISSVGSGSCKTTNRVGFEDGRVVVRSARVAPANVFAAGKVRLNAAAESGLTKGATKDSGDGVSYPAGSTFAVIVDAACLRANAASLTDTLISQAALTSGHLHPDLDDQAFEWTLPRAMTADDLSRAAEGESCVKGLSFNQRYQREALNLNDPQRGNQSYLAFDQADRAYGLAFGTPGLATTGSNVIVAVLDSGVDYTHPDLRPKMVAGYGADVSNNTSDPMDVATSGHGTHVAGMIAAASNNGVGISGVMPYRAQILAVRIFASASSSTSSQEVYSGVQYAISKGASVINLSIAEVSTGARTDAVLQQAMQAAVANGITVSTVIGNAVSGGTLVDGVNTSVLPGQYSTIAGVIGVGAVNAADGQKSSFSMYGTNYAEIGAVGAESGTTGVLSTVPAAAGSYGRLAGTSQAAPQVAAAAALAIAMIRNAYGASPDPAAIESLILDSADKRSELAPYFRNGNRLNLFNLVQLVRARYPLTTTAKSTGC